MVPVTPRSGLTSTEYGASRETVFLPARRRQKKLQDMISNLKSGDKVVTSGGIYGTIVGFRDDRIQLRVAENVKIELSRNAVTALQGSETE